MGDTIVFVREDDCILIDSRPVLFTSYFVDDDYLTGPFLALVTEALNSDAYRERAIAILAPLR